MINEVKGSRLEKKSRSTWPSCVKVIKTISGEKSATRDMLSILEKLYQDKTADHPVRRTRRE